MSTGLDPERVSLAEAQDLVLGLVAAGRWPDLPEWREGLGSRDAGADPMGMLKSILGG